MMCYVIGMGQDAARRKGHYSTGRGVDASSEGRNAGSIVVSAPREQTFLRQPCFATLESTSHSSQATMFA
jgi:hypothetical protein